MNFTMDAATLNQISKNMGGLLTARTTLPVLSGVLAVVEENEITFVVSNGQDTLLQRVFRSDEVDINTTGTTVLPRDFFAAVKKIMKGKIEVCTDGNIVTVKKGKTELAFTTMLADEYPRIPEEMPLSQLRYSGPNFKKIVEATAFCASTSETRPVLTGVNLQLEGKLQTFVATDSHRLGSFSTTTSDCLEEDQVINQVIPATALLNAEKSFDFAEDVILMTFKQTVALVNKNVIYHSSLIQGNYPDTSRIIPQEFTTEVVVNKQEVIDTLSLLSETSDKNVVQFTIHDEAIEVSAKNELAKGTAEITFGEKVGADLKVAFSSKYLLDAIKVFASETVRISYAGDMRPFIIRSTDENDATLQLILPCRTY